MGGVNRLAVVGRRAYLLSNGSALIALDVE